MIVIDKGDADDIRENIKQSTWLVHNTTRSKAIVMERTAICYIFVSK